MTIAQTVGRQLIVKGQSRSIISEQYRTLRTNIKFSNTTKLQTLVVTSAVQAEGKSTTAANLAYLFAEEGQNVLFIDADMRKPTVHFTFHLSNITGLSFVLSGQATLQDCIQQIEDTSLHVLTSGPIPPNPSEMLGSQAFHALLRTAEQHYDWIIIDTSPVLAVTDAQVLANRVDGTILVIDPIKSDKKMAKKAVSLLKKVDAHLLGVVLNNVEQNKDIYYYSEYVQSE